MKKTNKTFKRFAAITSASLLAACAMAPVFTSMTSYALEAGKINFIGTTETESYTAYKIFKGVAVENGFGATAMMSNIEWNTTTEGATTFLAALKTDERLKTGDAFDFASCITAEDVANVLTGYGYDNPKTRAFAELAVANKGLFTSASSSDGVITLANDTDDGYYVIEQTSHNGTTTAYLLGVYDATVGADVNVKVAAPSFQKKIKDINDSATSTVNAAEKWQDSADYDIKDTVPFQLTATLPTDYSTYKQYKLVFHDDLKDADGKAVFDTVNITKVYYDADNDNVCDDEEEITGYTSTVGGDAPEDTCDFEVTIANLKTAKSGIADGGLIKVEYTARLTENAVIGSAGNWNGAYLEYSNNPYYTGGTDDDTKTTAEDKVVAFTYQTVIDKITKDGTALEGATFKLEKKVPKTDGEGYNLVEIAQVEATPTSTFTFKGIDDGDYVLTEVSTPGAQYNSIAPIEFTVSATHDETSDTPTLTEFDATVTAGSATLNASLSGGDITKTNGEKHVAVSGEIYTEIINSTGTQLPGTGGIGTTIFYLGGGAMAAIGGIYLISKRRMRKSEE